MYTSCGWFFDDISGIETLQILRYAARVLQIAYPYDPTIVKDFLAELASGRSNVRPRRRGDEIFTDQILPEVSDLQRVSAHAAIMAVFENSPVRKRLYCYEIKVHDLMREDLAERTLLVARMTVLSRITTESQVFSLAAFHISGVDVRCSVDEFMDSDKYESMKYDLLDTFRDQSATELIRKLDKYFAEKYFTIKDLFVEQRRRILDAVTHKMYEAEAGLFEIFYKKNKDLGKLIVNHQSGLPDTFLTAARFALNRGLITEIKKLRGGSFPSGLESVIEEMKFWNIQPDLSEAEKLLRNKILALVGELATNPANALIPDEIIRYLDLCAELEIQVELGEAQISFFRTMKSIKNLEPKEYPAILVEIARRLAVRLSRT